LKRCLRTQDKDYSSNKMAEKKAKRIEDKAKKAEEKAKRIEDKGMGEFLVRIYGKDILGNKNIYVGLTKIKGVSWSISNVLCKNLGLKKNTKVSELGKEKIVQIEKELGNLRAAHFLKNRRADLEAGDTKHLLSHDLEMNKEFDIKRLKQIKSYKGIRHSLKLPVRGQRTRSHFRKSGITVGVKKKK